MTPYMCHSERSEESLPLSTPSDRSGPSDRSDPPDYDYEYENEYELDYEYEHDGAVAGTIPR
jgi:hypothetical protein